MALLVFIAPLVISSLRHVRLDTDVESWLPKNDPSAMEYAWCREHFSEKDKLIVTWEGSTLDDPRIPVFIGKLQGQVDPDGEARGGLPYVESVIDTNDVLQKMVEHHVDYHDAVDRLTGTFLGEGHLKVRLTDAGLQERQRTIDTILTQAQADLGLELTVVESIVAWQPDVASEDAFDELYANYLPKSEEGDSDEEPLEELDMGYHDFQLRWKGQSADSETAQQLIALVKSTHGNETADEPEGRRFVDDCFFSVGSPIALMVSLSPAGSADEKQALNEIRRVANESFIPPGQLILAGRCVASTELNSGVIKAAWNPNANQWYGKSVILLSALVGILFALISLKSLRLGALVIGVSYYAAILGVSMIPLTGGSLNMVLTVLPTLLMVLALSGAIHVANYWKHAVWEDPKTAVSRATSMARIPCMMAAFTTALGLISLAGSQLIPVRQFGIYAALGTLISMGMVLYGLPALLQMFPLRRARPGDVNPIRWRQFGALICRQWKPLTAFCVVTAVVCTVGLSRFKVETKVIKYFPEDSKVVQDYQAIEDTLAGVNSVEVIVRFDEHAQTNLRFLERLEVVREIETEIRKHPEVSGAISLADFQPVRKAPEADASSRTKIFFNRRSNTTEKRIKEGSLEGANEFLAMSNSVADAGDSAASLQPDELWRINAQAALLTDADITNLTEELGTRVQSIARKHAGVDHVVTGTGPLFLRTQRAVLESLILSSLVAFILIAIVMVWVLKDVAAGIFSMVPNLLPVISVFGLVSWFDQRIDIGTMVTASVALGIAVDGTLHLLTWFRDGLKQGFSREKSVMIALSHCGPAMWQTSAAVGIGLLVLFPAELLLISRFGWLMASLIGAALIGDLVLLPSLLVGPLGIIIERRMRIRNEITPVGKTPPEDQSTSDQAVPIPAHHFKSKPKSKTAPNPNDDPTRYVG